MVIIYFIEKPFLFSRPNVVSQWSYFFEGRRCLHTHMCHIKYCTYIINGAYAVQTGHSYHETPLPQRHLAVNSYYNPLAVHVHPPVSASGVLHEKNVVVSKKNHTKTFVFIKWSKTSKRKISKKKLKGMCK